MKSLAQLKNDLRQAQSAIQKLEADATRVFGIIAVKNIKNNFLLQGYNSGVGFTSWVPRKAATNKAYSRNRGPGKISNYKGSVYNAANPLLQQTRNLYNSIKAKVLSGNIVFIGINLDLVPYGQAHNEGLNHEPQRQFMPTESEGANPAMIKEFSGKISQYTEKIMFNFK